MSHISHRWPNGVGFAVLLFAVTAALNLSDYMSRYVVVALFGDLQREWSLTNAQLGALVSLVAIAVGLLTVPVALLCERIGKARGLVLMGVLWSVATFYRARAASYDQMLASRIIVGIGEAAYSSVGLAYVLASFPASMRARSAAPFWLEGHWGKSSVSIQARPSRRPTAGAGHSRRWRYSA